GRLRADVESHHVGGDLVGGHDAGGGVLGEGVGHDHVGGQSDPVAVWTVEQTPDGVDLVLFHQAGADLVAAGRQQGEAHAAAYEHRVHLGEEVLDDTQLVGHLRPAQDHD